MEQETKAKRRNAAMFDLSPEARKLLRDLAAKNGISMTAWLEVVIRQKAEIANTGRHICTTRPNEEGS
jgi:glycine cleavage system aminomethyltransferase T